MRWREYLEPALQIYRGLGHKKRIAEVLMDLTGRDLDDETNTAYLTELWEVSRGVGEPAWEAYSLRGWQTRLRGAATWRKRRCFVPRQIGPARGRRWTQSCRRHLRGHRLNKTSTWR